MQKLSGKAVSRSAPHENAAVVGARQGDVVIWDMCDGPQDARRRDSVECAFHKHLHVGGGGGRVGLAKVRVKEPLQDKKLMPAPPPNLLVLCLPGDLVRWVSSAKTLRGSLRR